MASHWYVIHVYSGFEKKVAQAIREQAEEKGVAERFEQILVPTEEVVEVKRGAKVSSERKFFPGYVLMKMDLDDETWHLVKNTAKVTGFLGGGGRPSPISGAGANRNQPPGARRARPSVADQRGGGHAHHAPGAGGDRTAKAVDYLRDWRAGASRRWAVHLLQRRRRGGRRGEIADQGCGVDLWPRDAGRARIFAGREGVKHGGAVRASRRKPGSMRQRGVSG